MVAVQLERAVEDVALLDSKVELEKVVDDELVRSLDVLDCKIVDSWDLFDGGGPSVNGGGAPYDLGAVCDASYDASGV